MFKWRDFYLMKVYNSKNKYIGVVEDISIDFNKGIIEGFTISPASIIKKHTFVSRDGIVSIDKVLRVRETSKFEGLKFKEIKFIDIINENKKLIGVLEDLIIDKEHFSIKGLIISSGIFDKMFKGKEIITLKHCTLYDNYILYNGNERIKLKTLPHNLGGSKDVSKA
ncbi:PRC-barrel domain-containing protein [uncultured Clostridium sp.]|uniref:PRC-barrel domain-containing protein n=1 Tax=uncultured Clostridium sp. TaxID=59620 RepID=UPI00260061F0|nr:PRC-barrel domain-containing protein [uncultured Clostridium sp.]MDU4883756.1 PRC-barrel domain-containing protein [Clostridium celatum]MDU7076972.1 PRC-barrel domain-containing protein [Clostridium celatum]